MVVYPFLHGHGYRQQPGGKATKFALKPKEAAYYGNLEGCYSQSSSQELAVSINEVVRKKTTTAVKSKAKPSPSKRSPVKDEQDSSAEWSQVMDVDAEFEVRHTPQAEAQRPQSFGTEQSFPRSDSNQDDLFFLAPQDLWL